MKGPWQGEQSSLACPGDEGTNARDKNKSLQFVVQLWCCSAAREAEGETTALGGRRRKAPVRSFKYSHAQKIHIPQDPKVLIFVKLIHGEMDQESDTL